MPLGRWAHVVHKFSQFIKGGGRGDGCLFIFEFSFGENKIYEALDDILVHIFHEDFDG